MGETKTRIWTMKSLLENPKPFLEGNRERGPRHPLANTTDNDNLSLRFGMSRSDFFIPRGKTNLLATVVFFLIVSAKSYIHPTLVFIIPLVQLDFQCRIQVPLITSEVIGVCLLNWQVTSTTPRDFIHWSQWCRKSLHQFQITMSR